MVQNKVSNPNVQEAIPEQVQELLEEFLKIQESPTELPSMQHQIDLILGRVCLTCPIIEWAQ